MPSLRPTKTFKKAFKKKTPDQQGVIERALKLLAEDPRHNSLHTHRIRSVDGVWGARATQGNRITFEWDGDTIVLRNNCSHDEALRKP